MPPGIWLTPSARSAVQPPPHRGGGGPSAGLGPRPSPPPRRRGPLGSPPQRGQHSAPRRMGGGGFSGQFDPPDCHSRRDQPGQRRENRRIAAKRSSRPPQLDVVAQRRDGSEPAQSFDGE